LPRTVCLLVENYSKRFNSSACNRHGEDMDFRGFWFARKSLEILMRYHLEREAFNNLNTWYARVPTEANVSDYPSRAVPHPLLPEHKDQSFSAVEWFGKLVNFLDGGRAEFNGGSQLHVPRENRV